MYIRHLILTTLATAWVLLAAAQSEPVGLAGVYGTKFEGRPTASGQLYSTRALTGAHKELAFGSLVRVVRLDNNQSVTIRINDRGPYIAGEIVTLSAAAADQIGVAPGDKARVKLVVVSTPGATAPMAEKAPTPQPTTPTKPVAQPKPSASSQAAAPQKPTASTTPPRKVTPKPASTPANTRPSGANTPPPPVALKQPNRKDTPTSYDNSGMKARGKSGNMRRLNIEEFSTYDLYRIQVDEVEKLGYAVQTAYLQDYESVLKQVAMLQENGYTNVLVSMERKQDQKDQYDYKVILGPYTDMAEAQALKKELKARGVSGFVWKAIEDENTSLLRVNAFRPEKQGFAVQIASIATYDGMTKVLDKLRREFFDNVLVSVEMNQKREAVYKIMLGTFPTRSAAESYQRNLQKKGYSGFVKELSGLQYP